MSVENPQLTGYLLNGIRSNFLYVEDSTTWTNNCPRFLPFLYEADKCFNCIRIYYKCTVIYFDPITKQTFDYSAPVSCDHNPQIVLAFEPDKNELYLLTANPVLRTMSNPYVLSNKTSSICKKPK